MKPRFLASSALLVAVGMNAAAFATPTGPEPSFAERLFATRLDGARNNACFVRVYDGDHLHRHPKQTVTRMKILLTAERLPEDEALNFSFRLGVALLRQRGSFDSSGDCGHAAVSQSRPGRFEISCSVDCDGGGIQVGLSDKSDGVIVRLPSGIRIWRKNNPDIEASRALEAGSDDGVFRLERAPLDQCLELVADRRELSAMRRR